MPSRPLSILLYTLLVRFKIGRSFLRRAYRKLTGHKVSGVAGSAPRPIPRTIWMFWDDGEDAAPPLVRSCIASWRRHNPDWTLHVLDRDAVGEFIDMPGLPPSMTIQAYTNLVRSRLLRVHGGVWADATSYCLKPLDHWLPVVAQYGFFAYTWTPADRWFLYPNVQRMLANFFLASEPDGKLITAWESASFSYWQGREAPHVYFWHHVLAEYLTITDNSFRDAWRQMPKFGAYAPHLVHDCVTRKRDPDEVVSILRSGAVPLQKLRWTWSEDRRALAQSILDKAETSAHQHRASVPPTPPAVAVD